MARTWLRNAFYFYPSETMGPVKAKFYNNKKRDTTLAGLTSRWVPSSRSPSPSPNSINTILVHQKTLDCDGSFLCRRCPDRFSSEFQELFKSFIPKIFNIFIIQDISSYLSTSRLKLTRVYINTEATHKPPFVWVQPIWTMEDFDPDRYAGIVNIYV